MKKSREREPKMPLPEIRISKPPRKNSRIEISRRCKRSRKVSKPKTLAKGIKRKMVPPSTRSSKRVVKLVKITRSEHR